jgi:hypothetical protein
MGNIYTPMSTAGTKVLRGKKLRNDIRRLAKTMKIDLSKADDKKTEHYLSKFPSLSKTVRRMRTYGRTRKQLLA